MKTAHEYAQEARKRNSKEVGISKAEFDENLEKVQRIVASYQRPKCAVERAALNRFKAEAPR